MSRRLRYLKAHRPGGILVDPRSCPKLVFPARLEEPGAGLLPLFPGLFSSRPSGFPALSQHNQSFPAQGPEKSHHGSSTHQVRSCCLQHSPQAAQPIQQLLPAGNERRVSQSPQETLNKLGFAPFLLQLCCWPRFPLLPISLIT